MISILLLALQAFAFHFYVMPGETECFREELIAETAMAGAFKLVIYDEKSKKYMEQATSKVRVVVYAEKSNHNLVDMMADGHGKFQFTAAENAVHLVCLSPLGGEWTNQKAKIYFDLQFYYHEEFKEPATEIYSI